MTKPDRYQSFLDFLSQLDDDSEDGFKGPPIELTELTIALFENCGEDFQTFSDEQLGLCIPYLLWTAPFVSDHVEALRHQDVPDELQAAVFSSMFFLYRDCFAKRCTSSLYVWNETKGKLNEVCWMMWDMVPLTYGFEKLTIVSPDVV